MGLKTQSLDLGGEAGERSAVYLNPVFPGEVDELAIEVVSIAGRCAYLQTGREDIYDLLLVISGNAIVTSADYLLNACAEQIVRFPHGRSYRIDVPPGSGFRCVRLRKTLTTEDIDMIRRDSDSHSGLYARKFVECPSYSEEIKSPKTVNRMLLPEGYVPRFCMGSVETVGPDAVECHEHPMLDQLFLGLKGCRCTCHAGSEAGLLLENTFLRVPLGSRHSVSVAPDDTLSYIWMDLFLTSEGQRYISEQHAMNGQ